MSLFQILSLSSVALASAASNVTLTAESSDKSIDGSFVQNIHFGAGFNGALLSSSKVTYDFNITDTTVFFTSDNFPYVLGETFGQLAFELGKAELPAKVDCNGYLTVNGSSSVIYACDKLSWDPYSLASSSQKGLALYDSASAAPSDCTAIKIKVTNTN